jgi:hypothetical protein
MFDGLVTIGNSGDDGGVFTAGLGEKIELRVILQHGFGGLGATG